MFTDDRHHVTKALVIADEHDAATVRSKGSCDSDHFVSVSDPVADGAEWVSGG